MDKGKRRRLLALVFAKLEQRTFFKQHSASPPSIPFPNKEKLPAVFVALTPASVRPETALEMQNDFRFSVVGLADANEELEFLKCDIADEIEEAVGELQVDPDFQAEFSQIDLETIDPGPLSLTVFGFEPLVISPPVGAVRMDYSVDFHYQGATS